MGDDLVERRTHHGRPMTTMLCAMASFSRSGWSGQPWGRRRRCRGVPTLFLTWGAEGEGLRGRGGGVYEGERMGGEGVGRQRVLLDILLVLLDILCKMERDSRGDVGEGRVRDRGLVGLHFGSQEREGWLGFDPRRGTRHGLDPIWPEAKIELWR